MKTFSEKALRKEYKKKANAIIKNFELALDSSFNRIDAQLDQILNENLNFMQIQPKQLSSDLQKFNSNTLLNLKNDDFQKQINKEVTFLMKSNIQKVLQTKKQQYEYQYKEAQTKWEKKIQDKDQNTSKLEQEFRQLKNEIQQNLQKNEQEIQKVQKQKEQEYQEIKRQKAIKEQQRIEKKMIKEIMMKKTQVSLDECGKLDICYVVDFTLSMQPYVEQVICLAQKSLKAIKFQTNRDTILSSIAYYDKEQKPTTGLYHQFDFSNNIQNFEKFIKEVKFEGGRDPPEDVRGALEQMMTNLEWKSKFKIAILITDSPCHGKKYHTYPIDFHPNDDITQTLHCLIEQKIILIGFNLNNKTVKMYEEFKKIYEAKNASEFFLYIDVADFKVNQLADQMAISIVSASINITQVKSSGTQSKKYQQERPNNKDGAIEALCKQADFYNFEKQTKVFDTLFKVQNFKINDQVFNNNIQSLNNIGSNPYNDYLIKEEGKWNCIRTELPFAFGLKKDVFLMKKKNGEPEELYVIKTPLGSKPYKSQLEAIQDCRSHLICQQLMKKFKNDISDALEQQNFKKNLYPNVVYSDLLILEETKDKFWIAERIFKGDFVKYNNNYGYINEEITEINNFAQAFSYYTFFISRGQYMINDVQGVGTYFTDPAINTSTGDSDDTDLGQEGQNMYLVNFQQKKGLAFDILNLLNLLNEDQEK
ncbi:unnamed protein product [Paramecium pentaurelia]|uniref:Alpha-type protein kinase domain-containing protein n=1 Tax=Paramecium pentaurelia TaxID=43138 RepID=A0A8S1TSS7_9CILI|nr:unnamed protein product [Paramecium pentaurelia]